MEDTQVPVQEEKVIETSQEQVVEKSGWDALTPLENTNVDENVARGTLEETQQTQVVETKVEDKPTFDENEWFKTKSGGKYEKWEDVEALLNKQPEVEKPKFANETSKNIYEAILAGKEDELADYFGKKQFAKTLAAQPTENVVKAYIKEQIPTLTETEVERYYQKNYGIDEDNFSDELDLSIAKKEAATKLDRVKEDALNYFNQKAEQVQLPTIEQQAQVQQQPTVSINKQITDFVTSKNKAEIGEDLSFEYVNNQNGANVQGKIPLDMKTVEEYKQNINDDVASVIAARYFKNDYFDSDLFAKHQYILDNLGEILKGSAAKSYNEGFLAKIARDKNLKVDEQPNRTGDTPDISNNLEMAKEYKWRGFPIDFIEKRFGVTADQLG